MTPEARKRLKRERDDAGFIPGSHSWGAMGVAFEAAWEMREAEVAALRHEIAELESVVESRICELAHVKIDEAVKAERERIRTELRSRAFVNEGRVWGEMVESILNPSEGV